jgi:hypothetical protein
MTAGTLIAARATGHREKITRTCLLTKSQATNFPKIILQDGQKKWLDEQQREMMTLRNESEYIRNHPANGSDRKREEELAWEANEAFRLAAERKAREELRAFYEASDHA